MRHELREAAVGRGIERCVAVVEAARRLLVFIGGRGSHLRGGGGGGGGGEVGCGRRWFGWRPHALAEQTLPQRLAPALAVRWPRCSFVAAALSIPLHPFLMLLLVHPAGHALHRRPIRWCSSYHGACSMISPSRLHAYVGLTAGSSWW